MPFVTMYGRIFKCSTQGDSLVQQLIWVKMPQIYDKTDDFIRSPSET